MSHNVETMAYHGEVPWHGLGQPVSDDMTPEEMMIAAGCNWTVSRRPLFAVSAADLQKGDASEGVVPSVQAGEHAGLFRDSDDSLLDVVGARYIPVQNAEVFDFFKRFTEAGSMKMHTAGSLCGGQFVWALAKMEHDLVLKCDDGGDRIENHLLLCSPHKLGRALIVAQTSVRVVCWNTLSMALETFRDKSGAFTGKDNADKNRGKLFRMPHVKAFGDSVKDAAVQALELSTLAFNQFAEQARVLSSVEAEPEKVEEYFTQLLRLDPESLAKARAAEEADPAMLVHLYEALDKSPGATLASAKNTWWGAVNAVTFVSDHVLGKQRDVVLRDNWMGHRGALKRRGLELALEFAKI